MNTDPEFYEIARGTLQFLEEVASPEEKKMMERLLDRPLTCVMKVKGEIERIKMARRIYCMDLCNLYKNMASAEERAVLDRFLSTMPPLQKLFNWVMRAEEIGEKYREQHPCRD